MPFVRLAFGTTLTLILYDGDPVADGQSVQTSSFTYGEDSEAGLAADGLVVRL